MRTLVTWIAVIVNVVTMVAMIVGVLQHSGRGGGLSDMFGGGVTSTMQSSGVAERNLNRITVILGVVWLAIIVTLGLIARFSVAG